jgi:hypothetical protein
VRIAKANLVATEANLAPGYRSWEDLVDAATAAMTRFNNRVHGDTMAIPTERRRSRWTSSTPSPEAAYTAAFGQTRAVTWSSTFTSQGARYSVLSTWAGKVVWVRVQGDELVAVAEGPAEVARHRLLGPGQVSNVQYDKRYRSSPTPRLPAVFHLDPT